LKPACRLRKTTRPAQFSRRIQQLVDQGKFWLRVPVQSDLTVEDPGTKAGFSGSVVIAEFDSLAEAQTWLT